MSDNYFAHLVDSQADHTDDDQDEAHEGVVPIEDYDSIDDWDIWPEWVTPHLRGFVVISTGANSFDLGADITFSKDVIIAAQTHQSMHFTRAQSYGWHAIERLQFSRMTMRTHDALIRKGFYELRQPVSLHSRFEQLLKMMARLSETFVRTDWLLPDETLRLGFTPVLRSRPEPLPWLKALSKGKGDRLSKDEYRALFDGIHFLPESDLDMLDANLISLDVTDMPAEAMTALLRYTAFLRPKLSSWPSLLEKVRSELDYRGYNSTKKLRGLNAA